MTRLTGAPPGGRYVGGVRRTFSPSRRTAWPTASRIRPPIPTSSAATGRPPGRPRTTTGTRTSPAVRTRWGRTTTTASGPAYRYGFESARHHAGPELGRGRARSAARAGSDTSTEGGSPPPGTRSRPPSATRGTGWPGQGRGREARRRGPRRAPDRLASTLSFAHGRFDPRSLLRGRPARELVEAIEPRRSFDDVVLPRADAPRAQPRPGAGAEARPDLPPVGPGRAALQRASGLAFHFAGPPGTGKTICAEALAYTLNQRLLVVRYSELESRWVGQTAKHVASVFRAAERQDAVLFFDEADAIAGRRFTSMQRGLRARGQRGGQRAAARAGDLPRRGHLRHQSRRQHRSGLRAADPHPHPLRDARRGGAGADLAGAAPRPEDAAGRRRGLSGAGRAYPRSGGDIKNAVLKAAQIATTEPGPDADQADPPAPLHPGHGGGHRGARRSWRSRCSRTAAAPARRRCTGGDVRRAGGAPGRAGAGGRAAGRAGATPGRALCRSSSSARLGGAAGARRAPRAPPYASAARPHAWSPRSRRCAAVAALASR